MDFTKMVDELHVEYIKNGYPVMWENQKEKGDEIYSLSSLAPEIKALALKMEHIRNGNPLAKCDASQLSAEEFKKASQIAELSLVITEVWEAIEAIASDEDPSKEYADILIRTTNGHKRNSDRNLEEVILEKHKENLTRGKLHSRKI